MTTCPACGASGVDAALVCAACGALLDGSSTPTRSAPVVVTPQKSSGPTTASRFPAGTVLGDRYRIIAPIGRGGMGEVVRAEDLSLEQPVALKFLPAHLAQDPASLDRVRAEVRLARRVSHPGVCRVHDLCESGSLLFISMEYIDGEDLATLLRRVGRLSGERALALARELCAGIAAAHAAGVIHRDLKPGNVMLDRQGRVKITDFGLAQLGDERHDGERIAGTPGYMAPEQYAGLGATALTDVYALGLVLYEIFTGRQVFTPGTPLPNLIRQQRAAAVLPPAQIVRDLDPAVDRIVLQCLENNPEKRPQSALDVLTALSGGDAMRAALAAGQTPSPSAVAAAPAKGVLKPLQAWACAAIVLAGLAVSVVLGPRIFLLDRVRPPLPPAALEAKALDVMRAMGLSGVCPDSASGFIYDDGAVRVAAEPPAARVPQAMRLAAERRMVSFWFRCSPVLLGPAVGTLHVTPDAPPDAPGAALAVLDVDGRLLRFRVAPNGTPSRISADKQRVAFAALTGLEPAPSPAPATTSAQMPGVADAGVGVLLDGAVPATLEMEFRQDRLIDARVIPPWLQTEPSANRGWFRTEDVPDLLVTLLIFVSVPLARRNLNAGRVDRQGAYRLGLAVFICMVVWFGLSAHHGWTFDVENAILLIVGPRSLWGGITSMLVYMALEPYVRRAWPERLVSWTRLLAGDFRDPMVARDVLIAVTATCGMAVVMMASMALGSNPPLVAVKRALDPLLGLPFVVASIGAALAASIRLGLLLLLLLLLLRVLDRVRGLGPTVFVAIVWIFGLGEMMALGVGGLLAIMVGGASAAASLVLVRFGLLSLTAALFVQILSLLLPNTTALGGWIGSIAICNGSLFVLLTVYGVYYSTGRRPFGERSLLDDHLA